VREGVLGGLSLAVGQAAEGKGAEKAKGALEKLTAGEYIEVHVNSSYSFTTVSSKFRSSDAIAVNAC
jgi:hypothetical protein